MLQFLHTMEDEDCCYVCRSKVASLCSGCKSVRYCSKAHQKLHWNEHKLVCNQGFLVDCNLNDGQFLVASRDLKPGIN